MDEEAIMEVRRHLHMVEADPRQRRRFWLSVFRTIEKRFPDIDIGCPDELVRRVEVEDREPVAA